MLVIYGFDSENISLKNYRCKKRLQFRTHFLSNFKSVLLRRESKLKIPSYKWLITYSALNQGSKLLLKLTIEQT